MGQDWMVVLNGFKAVREALVNQGDSVVDRPVQPLQIDIGNGVFEQGERTSTKGWKRLRTRLFLVPDQGHRLGRPASLLAVNQNTYGL